MKTKRQFCHRQLSRLTFLFALLACFGSDSATTLQGQEVDETRAGYRIKVSLPVTENVATRVKQQIQRIAEEAPVVVKAEKRPVMILEFDTRDGVTGQGSELGNCLNIALLLTDEKVRKLHTVAYIPRSRGYSDRASKGAGSQLKGHAVLIALACNEIAMHEDSAIGEAGIDIRGDASLEVANYSNIVGRRLTIPIPVATALVDKSLTLFRVQTNDGVFKFVDQAELDRMKNAGSADKIETMASRGELPMFASQKMLEMRLIRNRVLSLTDLARRLDVDAASLENTPDSNSEWNAVQLPLSNFIDSRDADWTVRMLTQHLNSNPDTNLVIVRMNTPGGEIEPCLRIARELAALDPDKIRTVAFVESTAVGPTSVIGIACDQLIMSTDAKLGGTGDVPVTEEQLDDSRELIKRFAEKKQIDWSVPMGLLDSSLELGRYRNKATGQMRILCEEERLGLDNATQWTDPEKVVLSEGISGIEAARLALAASNMDDFDQVKQDYQLVETPIELEPSPTDRWIENIARQLATPWIAAWLLFGAVFLLSTEMSHPGIGIPGFLGSICLMLFFWSQYLDGNAHWLEILLFVVGMVFIVLEVFVVPGFGIFGIGGLLMVVVGIVLASQSFIFPSTSEELSELPGSLAMVVAAGSGFFAAIFFLRKYVTTMPVFRRIMLEPPGSDESVSPEQRELRESVVNRTHLLGKSGTAETPLVPAGKARFGNELVDVITDGRLVERDQGIKVVEVVGNRVIVEPR